MQTAARTSGARYSLAKHFVARLQRLLKLLTVFRTHCLGFDRKANGKFAAFAMAVAPDLHGAAVQVNKFSDERQSDTETILLHAWRLARRA
jgi:hypothetical protein